MVFDPSLPANATKLRLAPGVIQDNWVAIEEAGASFKPYAINLNNRTQIGAIPNDPAAIADTYITYCKETSGGTPELYGISAAGAISQLTNGAPTVTASGNTFLPGGLIFSWASGNYTNNQQITVSGITTLYQVVITIDDSSPTPASRAYVYDINGDPGKFKVNLPTGNVTLRYMAIGI